MSNVFKVVMVLSFMSFMASGCMLDSEICFSKILTVCIFSFILTVVSGYLAEKGEKHGTHRRRA